MMKKSTAIGPIAAMIVIALFFGGCSIENNPNAPSSKTKVLKSETKWKVDISTDAKIFIKSYKVYNTDGKQIEFKDYNDAGNLVSQSIFAYASDSSSETIKYFNLTGNIDSAFNNIYVHDNSGNIIKQVSSDLQGNVISVNTYVYDVKGNILEKKVFSPDGKVISQTSYQYNYNQNGDISTRLINPGNNGSYQAKDSIVYRMDTFNVDRMQINSFGVVDLVYSYTYNSDGKITKEIQKAIDGTVINKYIYEYGFY